MVPPHSNPLSLSPSKLTGILSFTSYLNWVLSICSSTLRARRRVCLKQNTRLSFSALIPNLDCSDTTNEPWY